MNKYNINDMKIRLKAEQSKPEDWDNNNEVISQSEVKLIIFQPYNELEQKLYAIANEQVKLKDEEIILEAPKKQEEWFMKYDDEISGPFSINELIFRATDLNQKEVKCKRNIDNVFIDLLKIKEIAEDEDKINEEFQKMSIKVYSDVFRPQMAKKSMKYLAEKGSAIQIIEVFRRINGKDFEKALKILNSYTGMKKDECSKFLNLFISEIGIGFLTNKK